MKKAYSLLSFCLLLVAGVLCSALPARAQWTFAEDFAYPEGDLSSQSGGKWFTNSDYYRKNPVQVKAGSLSVSGCPLGTTTNVADMHNGEDNESLVRIFDESDRGIAQGEIWLAAYVNVAQAAKKHTAFITFVGRTMAQDVAVNSAPLMWGNVTYGPGTVDGKYRLGVVYNRSRAPQKMTADLDYGTTYLVVARMKLDGKGNEEVTLFVNPESYTETPAEETAVGTDGLAFGSTDKGYGYKAVMLNQSLSWGYGEGKLQVGALRVSDTYAGLFAGGDTPAQPELKAEFEGEMPYVIYKGVPYHGVLSLSGANLTDDVTLSTDSEDMQLERTTIPATEVMAEGGVKVPFTVSYSGSSTSGMPLACTVTAKSGDAELGSTTFNSNGLALPMVSSLKEFQSMQAETYEALLYTGHAVVSFVDSTTSPATYYLQDAEGGIKLTDDWGMGATINWQQGDSVNAFGAYVGAQLGVNYLVPLSLQPLTASAHGQKVEAVEATVEEVKENVKNYVNRLVKFKKVTLSGFDEGAQFAEGMTQPTFTDADGHSGKVRIFKQTSLIGTAIPTGKVNLSGLVTSANVTNGPIVAPRGTEDVEEVLDPSFEVDQTQFLKARGKVGETTVVGTVHVKSVAQDKDITIVPSGAVEGIYSADVTTIPAGNYEGDINLTYTPAKVGKDKGNLYFMLGDDVLATVKLEGMATDPANPPSVSIKPASLSKEYTAFVGEEVKDTVLITPYGMPDYVNVTLQNDSTKSFTTSTSLLMTQGEQRLVITYSPKAAGESSATVTIRNEFIDPIVIRLSGLAADKPVEPVKEGDDLPLVSEHPLTSLAEPFTDGEHNKPLALEGWKNLALEGTRAWWGYTFPDYDEENAGEKAAKVTAYDSKVESGEGTPCQMLLVTPALDFENAKSKFFTFRVMGQNLTDDMTDKLELCYIWLENGEMQVEPIGGVDFPASKNQSGEWAEFHVDLTGQNIEPTFFMGFRFTSERGSDHAAVYYIDDVTFGSTTLPTITTDKPEITFEAAPGERLVSEPVNVITENLVEPVKIAMEGADKEHFAISATEVPAEGGQFTVLYRGAESGSYAIYVKLTSRGAVTKRMIVSASSIEGIQTAEVTANARVEVYDAAGRQLLRTDGAQIDTQLRTLPAGTYVLRFHTPQGVRTVKVAR